MAPIITQLVITDGRMLCLERTLASFEVGVNQKHISRRVIVNDCPDPDFGRWIERTFSFDSHIKTGVNGRAGFAGAIQAGWSAMGATDYVLHLEDDFTLTRHWPVREVVDVLGEHPRLAQMALRRQAVNAEEIAAGGIVECWPDEYRDVTDRRGRSWLEHRLFFTTNPSIYPLATTRGGWPSGSGSEGQFSLSLFQNPQAVCGFWGKRADPPWVTHIGEVRTGKGY
ncbi:galactosyltransferase [Caudovirales GX15bay]|nr:galactosyltransferase [Caudovirales GX15bay]